MFPIYRSLVLIPALILAGCAAAPAEQSAASTDCKVAVATFAGKPIKDATPAEQAEAQLKFSRLASARGGYRPGSDMLNDVNRGCY